MSKAKGGLGFYHFAQNNSGGYFVNDNKAGVCEHIIIEAESAKGPSFGRHGVTVGASPPASNL